MATTPKFSYRPQQRTLARILRQALTQTAVPWLIEAGTGIGKSVAALAEALMRPQPNHDRVIIAVPTLQLQHQYLATRDRFFPGSSLPLVEGLSNYICLRRARQLQLLTAIRAHTNTHPDGLLVDLLPPLAARTEELGITYGECKNTQCEEYNECYYFEAKRRGTTASTVLTNHSVILAQLRPSATSSSQDPDAIPSLLHDAPYLLIDEAHALEDQTKLILTHELTPDRLRHHIHALVTAVLSLPKALDQTLKPLQVRIDTYENTLLTILGPTDPSHQLSIAEHALANASAHPLVSALNRTSIAATSAADSGIYNGRDLTALERFAGKLLEAADNLATFIAPIAPKNTIISLERKTTLVKIVARPRHVGGFLETRLWPRIKGPTLLSATLTTNPNPIAAFTYTLLLLGLWNAKNVQTRIFATPWKPNVTVWEPSPQYPAIHDPTHPAQPPSPAWFLATAHVIARAATQPGNVLVLCNSYQMVRDLATLLPSLLSPQRKLILHNSSSTTHTAETDFRNSNGLGVMLTASPAFRAGADFPGQLLTQLIICRLPFEVPTPGITMTSSTISRAVIHFRQAIGRLIRTPKDAGELYILDNRLREPHWRTCFLGGPQYRFLWPTVGNNVHLKEIPTAWWQHALQPLQPQSPSSPSRTRPRAKRTVSHQLHHKQTPPRRGRTTP